MSKRKIKKPINAPDGGKKQSVRPSYEGESDVRVFYADVGEDGAFIEQPQAEYHGMPAGSRTPVKKSVPSKKGKKRRTWQRSEAVACLLGFVLIAMVGAFIGGLFIGKTNPAPNVGSVIELDKDAQTVSGLIISGRLVDGDGNPLSGMYIRLQSEPRFSITDDNGYFNYIGVSAGEHELSLLGEGGDVLATLRLNIVGNTKLSSISFAQSVQGGYDALISADVKLAEIVFEYDDAPTVHTLDIYAASTMVVTDTANLISTTGTVSAEGSAVITPGGAVLLPDNTIVLSGGNIVDKDGKVSRADTQAYTAACGAIVGVDGKITLPNGTVISGSVVTFAGGGTVTHIIGTAVRVTDEGTLSEPSSGAVITPTEGQPIIGYQDSKQWDTYINLFGTPEGATPPVILPGSSGEYTFQIKNPNDFDMTINLIISEQAHAAGAIPLNYRLKAGNAYLAGDAATYVSAAALAQFGADIGAGKTATYTIEWLWPLSGNDQTDTNLGTADNKIHIVNVRVYGTQK